MLEQFVSLAYSNVLTMVRKPVRLLTDANVFLLLSATLTVRFQPAWPPQLVQRRINYHSTGDTATRADQICQRSRRDSLVRLRVGNSIIERSTLRHSAQYVQTGIQKPRRALIWRDVIHLTHARDIKIRIPNIDFR